MKGSWRFLLAYDIRDPFRLTRIAKIMENYGVRVQKSIFEAALSETDFKILRLELIQVMDQQEDEVKFFPLCERCSQKVVVLGQGYSPDLFENIVVI